MRSVDKLVRDNLIAYSVNVALSALLGGKRPRGWSLIHAKSLATSLDQPYMLLVTHPSSEVELQVIVDAWSIK